MVLITAYIYYNISNICWLKKKGEPKSFVTNLHFKIIFVWIWLIQGMAKSQTQIDLHDFQKIAQQYNYIWKLNFNKKTAHQCGPQLYSLKIAEFARLVIHQPNNNNCFLLIEPFLDQRITPVSTDFWKFIYFSQPTTW